MYEYWRPPIIDLPAPSMKAIAYESCPNLFIKFKQAVAILSLIAGNLSVLSVLPMLVLTHILH